MKNFINKVKSSKVGKMGAKKYNQVTAFIFTILANITIAHANPSSDANPFAIWKNGITSLIGGASGLVAGFTALALLIKSVAYFGSDTDEHSFKGYWGSVKSMVTVLAIALTVWPIANYISTIFTAGN